MSHDQPERCHKEKAMDAPPLFQNGNVNFQVYHIGWIISGAFALVAVVASIWLIDKHLQWYTNKREQRYIVRLLFLVPIYAVISFASFIFWNHATPLILVRDAYEAIVLTAFFYLLLVYISHDPEEQKKVFLKRGLSLEADTAAKRKGVKVQKWMWPLGFVKWKPKNGLYFLQLMKWGVLQYCVVRPTTTLAAVILEYMGLYCETSWGLGWGHIWIMLIISISVTIAMYCLIQLYIPVSEDLSRHKPLLKLFAIKAVVFLTFWQATLLSVLSMAGVVKDTQYMTAEDINIGIGALLEDFEMMLFAFLHIRAFTYKVYRPEDDDNGLPAEKTPRWRSLGHAMDFRETFREIWVGCVYMYEKMRGREPKLDRGVLRAAHYEQAFGRQRVLPGQPAVDSTRQPRSYKGAEKVSGVEVAVHKELEVEGERQWLGFGKYGFFNPRRERSEALQDQIDRELEKLGHPTIKERPDHHAVRHERVSTNAVPWWRSLYNRISHHSPDPEADEPDSPEHPSSGLSPRQDQRRRRSQSSHLVPKSSRHRTPSGGQRQSRKQHRTNRNISPVSGPSWPQNPRDRASVDTAHYPLLQTDDRLLFQASPRSYDDDTSRYPPLIGTSSQVYPTAARPPDAPTSTYQKVQEWRHHQYERQPQFSLQPPSSPPRIVGTSDAQRLRDARIPSLSSPPPSPRLLRRQTPHSHSQPHPHRPRATSAHRPDAIPERPASPPFVVSNARLTSESSSPPLSPQFNLLPPLSPPLPPLSPFEPRLNTSFVAGPNYVQVPSVLGGGHSDEAVVLLSGTDGGIPNRQRSSRVMVELPGMGEPEVQDTGASNGPWSGGANFDTRSSSHRREPAAALAAVFPKQTEDQHHNTLP